VSHLRRSGFFLRRFPSVPAWANFSRDHDARPAAAKEHCKRTPITEKFNVGSVRRARDRRGRPRLARPRRSRSLLRTRRQAAALQIDLGRITTPGLEIFQKNWFETDRHLVITGYAINVAREVAVVKELTWNRIDAVSFSIPDSQRVITAASS
jgi:hypothetical protein